jgi:copper transport protein
MPSFGDGSSSAPATLLRSAVNRFSALALGCVTVLVITGGFQAWRQVGSLEALRDTDFGRVLLVKLVVFAAMIVAAAFSREVVNRRFRDAFEPDVLADGEPVPVLVGAPALGSGGEPVAPDGPNGPRWNTPSGGNGDDPGGAQDPDDEEIDRQEARRLRWSVLTEVGFAVVVLAVTAVLVNTAPARTESTEPVALSMRSGGVFADVTIAPGVAGRNDIHVTVLPTGADTVTDMQLQLTRPGEDLPPFDVPLRPVSAGHETAPQYNIPFPGEWRLVLRVQLGTSDEVVLTDEFTIR